MSAGVDLAGELASVAAVAPAGVAPSVISFFARRTFPCAACGESQLTHAQQRAETSDDAARTAVSRLNAWN